jgi:hypothetical protein
LPQNSLNEAEVKQKQTATA